MKKTLLLLASAVLLLVGCQKEQIAEKNVGGEGLQTVSFTVGLESAVTKAVADNDGKAAKINHWVIQVIDSDNAVYHYKAEDGVVGEKTHTFDVPLIKGQTYDVLFWADTDGKYVVTDLRNVKRTEAVALKANSDSLDAFSAVVKDFTTTVATQKTITLKRPFAQLNVVFTDLKKLYETMNNADEYAKFITTNFVAKAKVPTTFNVLTQEAGAPATTALEMKAATNYKDNYAAHGEKATLYMDYILASAASKDVVDIDFSFVSKGVTIAHNFAAVPFQRNYRTNILGDLMSANAKWVVEVDPNWDSLEDGSKDYNVNYYEPSSIQDAQDYIENDDDQKAKTVDLSKYTVTAGDFDPNADDKTIKFELKTTSPADMVNFTLPAIPADVISAGCTGWKITHETGYPTQNVNVTAPTGTLVTIDAPRSHVTLNGELYEQVTATTSQSTLVVPAGVTVKNLIVKEGAVEIHGTVNALTVSPTEGKTVVFRECEGLSAGVFKNIYSTIDPVCNYLDPMYTYKQVGEKFDIYKLPVVAMIGETEYPSLAAAIAAVPANNTQLVTINVMSDVVLKKADALDINKNNVVIDGQYHTIALDENDPELAQYLADGTNGTYGKFQMIKVSGNDVTLKNLTLDCKNYRGASLATTNGGKNASYENIVYKGLGSGHYYGSAGTDGTLTFKNCTFETHGYAIHTAECKSVLEVSDCEIHGWVSYGDKTKSATFTNTHFYSTEDAKNGVLATIRPYCVTTITNCTFSKEYLVKYKYDGLTVRKNVVVSLNGCSVEDGELCDIANITCPDDPWVDGGVIAIDATGNATDGFTAGTFVAKQAADINVATSYEATAVAGKDNVWTVAVKPAAEFNGQEYASFEAALNAAKAAKGGKVTLVDDVTLTRTDYKGCSSSDEDFATRLYTIDLNGHKISGGLFAFEDCSYTIEDSVGGGSISRDGSCLQLNVSQFMASKMCTFETCPTFTVTGGEFIGTGNLDDPFNCKYGAQIGAQGTYDHKQAVSKFLISGGKIRNMRIYNGKGEISGGTFEGQLKIEVCTEGSDKYVSGVTYSDLVCTITGGTFNLAETNPIFGADYAKDHLSEQLCIKGGTFNFDPSVNYSACIPADYVSQNNGDGTWTVVAEN